MWRLKSQQTKKASQGKEKRLKKKRNRYLILFIHFVSNKTNTKKAAAAKREQGPIRRLADEGRAVDGSQPFFLPARKKEAKNYKKMSKKKNPKRRTRDQPRQYRRRRWRWQRRRAITFHFCWFCYSMFVNRCYTSLQQGENKKMWWLEGGEQLKLLSLERKNQMKKGSFFLKNISALFFSFSFTIKFEEKNCIFVYYFSFSRVVC